MNVIIRLVLMIGLIGSFNAEAMKNIKTKDISTFGKNIFNKNISKTAFPKTSFSTSALFKNQKFNAIPKNLIAGQNNLSAKKFDSMPKRDLSFAIKNKDPMAKDASKNNGFFNTSIRGYSTAPEKSGIDSTSPKIKNIDQKPSNKSSTTSTINPADDINEIPSEDLAPLKLLEKQRNDAFSAYEKELIELEKRNLDPDSSEYIQSRCDIQAKYISLIYNDISKKVRDVTASLFITDSLKLSLNWLFGSWSPVRNDDIVRLHLMHQRQEIAEEKRRQEIAEEKRRVKAEEKRRQEIAKEKPVSTWQKIKNYFNKK